MPLTPRRIRRGKGRPFTCADLDHHLAGACEAQAGPRVIAANWEGTVWVCPKCGDVFLLEDAHCLKSKHMSCKVRMRG